MTAKHYMGLAEIAALFNVTAGTVSKWRTRYAETHPTPEPTVWIGDTPGWDNASAWKGWKETLPGRGAGGGPLPLNAAVRELDRAFKKAGQGAQVTTSRISRMALHLAAAEYGVDADTIMAVWVRIAEENPNMPNKEIDQRAVATIMRGRKQLTQ